MLENMNKFNTLITACYFMLGIIFGAAVSWRIQSYRMENLRNIVATIKAQGEQSIKIANIQIERDKKSKEQSDNDHKTAIDNLNADIKRLRNNRPRTSFVPTTATSAGNINDACFDRAELESAIREFDAGIQRLVDEGSESTVDLNSAKNWARKQ